LNVPWVGGNQYEYDKMATCNKCGQEIRGMKYAEKETIFADTREGLVEAYIIKTLPSKRYRIRLSTDTLSSWGMWDEDTLYKSEEEYLERQHTDAENRISKIIEEIEEIQERYDQKTLVTRRFPLK
jgi:hypothetical protein